MTDATNSRRDLLKAGGAAFAGAVLGIGGWEASRAWRADESGHRKAEQGNAEGAANGAGNLQAAQRDKPLASALPAIIDVHVHAVSVNLSGRPEDVDSEPDVRVGPVEQVAKAIGAQLKEGHVEHALCMPTRGHGGSDVLGVERTRQLAKRVPGLHPIGLADPERFDEEHLARVDEELARGDVVAFKAYLGYLHFGPDAPGYRPYYKLAAKHNIPVIFHTGDTWSHLARLKYAHPLPIDDVAVDFPDTNFVLAHLGNPWLMDAAELIYKNNKTGERENVWADLSGILVGTAEDFANSRRSGSLQHVIDDVRKAIEFAERPDRFLFGSDWPLAPFAVYRDFVAELIPPDWHQAVFYDNAKKLFRLTSP